MPGTVNCTTIYCSVRFVPSLSYLFVIAALTIRCGAWRVAWCIGLGEVQCVHPSGSGRVRYPFAPFRAEPANPTPFFPADLSNRGESGGKTEFGALPVPLPQTAWLSLFTQLPYVLTTRGYIHRVFCCLIYACVFVVSRGWNRCLISI